MSEFGLGTRLFGESMDLADCGRVLDVYEEMGGNLLDTAVTYAGGRSEEFLGRLLMGGRRDRFVLSTKFGLRRNPEDANSAGASRRNLRRSLDESLRRLRTDHVDLLWLHAWYPGLPVAELLLAARDEIAGGRALSLGMSNAPAWCVSQAQTMAELRGWDSLCGVQVEYSLLRREAETDFLPMTSELGLALVGWSPLGRGRLLRAMCLPSHEGAASREERIAWTLASAAHASGLSPASIALRWVTSHGVIPLVGARTASQLREVTDGDGSALPDEYRRELDQASETGLVGLDDLLRETRSRIDPTHAAQRLPLRATSAVIAGSQAMDDIEEVSR